MTARVRPEAVDIDVGAITMSDPAMAEGLLPPDSAVWLALQPRGLSLMAADPAAAEVAS